MSNSPLSILSARGGATAKLGGSSLSNVASVEVVSFVSDGYDVYVIRLLNLSPVSDGVQLRLRTSSDGGTSYDNGASAYQYTEKRSLIVGVDPTLTENRSTAEAYIPVSSLVGNASNESLSGEIVLYSPDNSATYTQVAYRNVCLDASNKIGISSGSGCRSDTGIVDAIKIYFDTGNISSGEVYIYGVKLS